eukprot:ANDGO_05402.mRNA.1 Regulator of telomere elongation helicase 1 homolog
MLIGGVDVQFPSDVKPYPSQVAVVSRIIKALDGKQHALLESPTGTGKSLALICGVLSWVARYKRRKLRQLVKEALVAQLKAPEHNDHTTQGISQEESWAQVIEIAKREYEGDLIPAEAMGKKPLMEITEAQVDKEIEQMESVGFLSRFERLVRAPKVFFSSRTHSQIQHLIAELRRTPFRPRMTLLASRDHLCINDKLMQSVKRSGSAKAKRDGAKLSKNEACHELLDTRGCFYQKQASRLEKHSKIRSFQPFLRMPPPSSSAFKDLESSGTAAKEESKAADFMDMSVPTDAGIFDLEEIVSIGRSERACPYFASRELVDDSDIVFCPYNYLVEPSVRASMQSALKNAIVVIDEGHNWEDVCREAASVEVEWISRLEESARELKGAADLGFLVNECRALHSVVVPLVDWCKTQSASLESTHWSKDGVGSISGGGNGAERVFSGWDLVAMWEHAGVLTAATMPSVLEAGKAIGEYNNSVSSSSKGGRAGKADTKLDAEERIPISPASLALLESLFSTLTFMYLPALEHAGDFHVRLSATRLGIWCLNPSVAFGPLRNDVHSVLITSGTLSPMLSFSSELSTPFPHILEAPHVISPADDVLVYAMERGPGPSYTHVTLEGTYQKSANDMAYRDAIAESVCLICENVPAGVLCFFPSYHSLRTHLQRWKSTPRIWQRIQKAKPLVLEEPSLFSSTQHQEADENDNPQASSFEGVISAYHAQIRSGGGALLLAVCRGKISEGIDFPDDLARAVIIVGIPFPSIKDSRVDAKKKYNDSLVSKRGLLDSQTWYTLQAFRACNQAMGRVVRHQRDFGTVYLLDSRFARYRGYLSKWVQKALRPVSAWNDALQTTRAFFDAKKHMEIERREQASAAAPVVAAEPALDISKDQPVPLDAHVFSDVRSAPVLVPAEYEKDGDGDEKGKDKVQQNRQEPEQEREHAAGAEAWGGFLPASAEVLHENASSSRRDSGAMEHRSEEQNDVDADASHFKVTETSDPASVATEVASEETSSTIASPASKSAPTPHHHVGSRARPDDVPQIVRIIRPGCKASSVSITQVISSLQRLSQEVLIQDAGYRISISSSQPARETAAAFCDVWVRVFINSTNEVASLAELSTTKQLVVLPSDQSTNVWIVHGTRDGEETVPNGLSPNLQMEDIVEPLILKACSSSQLSNPARKRMLSDLDDFVSSEDESDLFQMTEDTSNKKARSRFRC